MATIHFASNLSPLTPKAFPQPARTVQLSLDADAGVLIENADGKRIGVDFKTKQLVNEIPDARKIDGETSAIFLLPFDKSGKLYRILVQGKPAGEPVTTLSLTGPGFISGFRSLRVPPGQAQAMSISADGANLSWTATEDGATPQLFLTTQSSRDKPSYRFEIASPSLANGKAISVNLDLNNGKLYLKSDDTKKSSFSVMLRRTMPGGARENYNHQVVSFGRGNSYSMDFGHWDGKGDVCFYETCEACNARECTRLRNDHLPPK